MRLGSSWKAAKRAAPSAAGRLPTAVMFSEASRNVGPVTGSSG